LSVSYKTEKIYKCQESDRNKICTKQIIGVCGWFNKNLRSSDTPCAKTYGTVCQACSDRKVAYVTDGVCPNSL